MLQDAIKQAQSGEIAILTDDDLTELLAQAELVAEEDTYVSGMIRILRFADLILVQETTGKKQVIIRSLPAEADAREFVARRMKTYERMWDSCAVRVSYFDR